MAYSFAGLNAALAGVVGLGTHLSLHTGAPGVSGANIDDDVALIPATWAAPETGSVESTEVPFEITSGGGTRTYSHFGVWSGDDPGLDTYVTGGPLDASEQFSDNGGTLNLTATLTAATATP